MNNLKPEWIGADWGTSNLRVFALDRAGKLLGEKQSDRGMATLQTSEYERTLLSLIDPWLSTDQTTPVIICGMAGARQGWKEARYRTVPSTPASGDNTTRVTTTDPRLAVYLLPGLCQQKPSDVMRGEETQLAGLLALIPDYNGVVCLPGTHSKWACISDGQVVRFKTFMTGELFAILSEKSVLRHSVDTQQWDQDAFLAAAIIARKDPAMAVSTLFSLRAESLLLNTGAAQSRSTLSGLLIGQELGLVEKHWLTGDVVIIGAHHMARLYQAILLSSGSKATLMDTRDATVAGLSHAAMSVKQS